MSDTNHQDLILDQFTRQATVFSTAPTITDGDALRMIVEAARPTPGDCLLDVACGPGLVVCAFAPHVQRGDRDRCDPGNARAGAQARG